jgi:hypothetical protein
MKSSTLFTAATLLLALAAAPGLVEAKSGKSSDAAVMAVPATAAEFANQVVDLRKEMGPRGRFSTMTADERARVEVNLDVITQLFAKEGEFNAMGNADKVALVNAQEAANAILTRNDDDRLICKMERPTGSNFKQKQCMTVRQSRELRERTRDGMDRYGTPGQPALDPGGGR